MSYGRRRLFSQIEMSFRSFSNSRTTLSKPRECWPTSSLSPTGHMMQRFQVLWFSANASQAPNSDISGNLDSDALSGSSHFLSSESGRAIPGGFRENNAEAQAFFRKLDNLPKGRDSVGSSDWLSEGFGLPSDGMTGKLAKAATFFEFDEEEIAKEDYTYRPDITFRMGTTYNTKDLDLSKPRPSRLTARQSLELKSKDVLHKADFRNVQFLAKFITEAGIIIKRKQTGISAKAQRKVAREIKTARAFGLLPFTTMGTKSFAFGKSMEPIDRDYEYEPYDSFPDDKLS